MTERTLAHGQSLPAQTAADASVNRTIGVYRLEQPLGEGGMAEVWLAEQTSPVQRQVAVKLVKPGMDSKRVLARFEAERQALALMVHPAIAKVYDGGSTSEGRPYFVMEYVPGVPLTDHCDRERLAVRERLELFMQVCEGVQHAHQKAIIHRDLKPSNVLVTMVDGKPLPKIIDFGIAKAIGRHLVEHPLSTELGALVGTPEYMSPEQADPASEDIDTRADVYSLGVMLYELLSGALPFSSQELRGSSLTELRRKIREVDPPAPSARLAKLGEGAPIAAQSRRTAADTLVRELRGDLDAIAMKALEKERSRRYGSASELAGDVGHYLRSEPVGARRAGVAYRLSKYVRRNRTAAALAALAFVASIGFSLVIARQLRDTRASLAAALIGRAQAAERDLDWGLAAAYYGASRVQRDSLRARWGIALNLPRMPRMSQRALENVERAEVGFLSDGRAVLAKTPGDTLAIVEEADSGRELWRATLPSPVASIRLGAGVVVVYFENGALFHAFDILTGRLIAEGPKAVDSEACIGASGPPPAWWRGKDGGGFRLEVADSPAPVVLAETNRFAPLCAATGDGTRVAAYLPEEGVMAVWDLRPPKLITKKAGPAGAPIFTAHGLAVPAENSTEFLGGPRGDFSIAGGSNVYTMFFGEANFVVRVMLNGDHVDVMDLEDRRMVATIPTDQVLTRVGIAGDGSRLVAVASAQPTELIFWTLPRPPSVELHTPGPSESNLTRFSRDASRFAATSGPDDQTRIDVWTREGALIRSLSAEGLRGNSFSISADGSRLAVLRGMNRASVWDVESSTFVLDLECSNCGSAVLSPDGSLVLANTNPEEVALWDIARRERRWRRPRKGYARGSIFSDDGARVAWTDDFSLIIAATDSGETLMRIPYHGWSSIAFSHDGKRIAGASKRGVSLWKTDGTLIWSSPKPVSKRPAMAVRWSLDDSKLILSDDESSILDGASGELLVHLDPEARSPQPRSFVSPDLRYVVKRGRSSWSLQPLPPPEEGPPARVLAGVLQQAGLQLRGAEIDLVRAPPASGR